MKRFTGFIGRHYLWTWVIALLIIGSAALWGLVFQFNYQSSPPPDIVVENTDLDCPDIRIWREAFVVYSNNLADPHGLDADKDGVPCEDLPGAP